jgi:mono/diheme cytochrome c family protein
MRIALRSLSIAAILIALVPTRYAFPGATERSATPDHAAITHRAASADDAPVLTPAQTMASYRLPAGYKLELVAAEPLVQDPVAIDFDPDGRMYVVEMRAFMPNLAGTGEDRPIGRVVILEDTNDDGKMDKKTVFLDSLVLPRSVKVLSNGVLVAETPNLWLARDTNGDGKADTKELVRDDYGTKQSNPEHNANGFVWGLDNWIHNANYAGEFRERGGKLEYRRTPSEGQWGLSMDSYGRIYRNSNEDPLHVDLVSEHYGARSASQSRMRGLYEEIIPNVEVFPAHATPAVNRGYQPQVLRADSTLRRFTSASSPTAYVGDRLPAELRDNVFITEPAGNLVERFIVREDSSGMLTARAGDERPSFLASTDVRSRPVFTTTAPDGTLYVVDMYRGIIQHRVFITGYLEEQIKKYGLEQPVGLGRIYRVVHTTTRRAARPRLSRATPAQLVSTLAHPNGWWRITAQRLLVERGDRSVVPALVQLVRSAPSDVTRLHALWTLDGLGAVDDATLGAALSDKSQYVRAAAVRIAEPALGTQDAPVRTAVLKLTDDATPAVRRQLAASLGELPVGERERALAAVTARSGADPVVADLVASGLAGRERAFLEQVLASASGATSGPAATVQALAGALLRARDSAGVQQVLAWASEESRPRWQRLALLDGLQPQGFQFGFGSAPAAERGAGAGAGGAGGAGNAAGAGRAGGAGGAGRAGDGGDGAGAGGRSGAGAGAGAGGGAGAGAFGGGARGGGRGAGGGFRGGAPAVALSAAPTSLLAMAEGADSAFSVRARRIAATLDWPGKPRPVSPDARPLTAEERERYAAGQQVFTNVCAGCHQANGQGLPGVAKSLVGSRWALAPAPQVIRIVLHGKEGEMLMPPVGGSMTDDQLAAVLTYVRRSWGNTALPITPDEVREIRGATAGRKKAWTEAELAGIRR